RRVFGDELDAIRSIDLVAELNKDPERPWIEWGKGGKPLTQKQLGGLLRDFSIISETVSLPPLPDAKGYKRERFEEAWKSYLPGQNTPSRPKPASEASKRRNADATGITRDFSSVAAESGDVSKNGNLSNNHAGSDASTLRKPKNGGNGQSDHNGAPYRGIH